MEKQCNQCLVCLKITNISDSYENRHSSHFDLYSKLCSFAKSYLKISSGNCGKIEDGNGLVTFCEDCETVVGSIYHLNLEQLVVQLRLSWKLGELADLLEKFGGDDWRNLMRKKCQEKRREILPQVVIERVKTSLQTVTPSTITRSEEEPFRKVIKLEITTKDDELDPFPKVAKCFICLMRIGNWNTFTLMFLNFAKEYLQIAITSDDLKSANKFNYCGECKTRVKTICGFYLEMLAVRKNLAGKLGELEKLLEHCQTEVKLEFPVTSQQLYLRKELYAKCKLSTMKVETFFTSESDEEDSSSKEKGLSKIQMMSKTEKCSSRRNLIVIPPHIKVFQTEANEMPSYEFTFCGKQFKTKNRVKYHEHCQKSKEGKLLLCEQCGDGFTSQISYDVHRKTEHTKELKLFNCPKCSKGFKGYEKLKFHLKRKHGDDKPYLCSQCPRRFGDSEALRNHEMKHAPEKRFLCKECERSFDNPKALRTHMVGHAGDEPFVCQVCKKGFRFPSTLKVHMVSHTGAKPFSCTYCPKTFGLKPYLEVHLRTHTGERPFKCEQCSKAFRQKSGLQTHLRIHTGEKPFRCSVCDELFTYKFSLEQHMKKLH